MTPQDRLRVFADLSIRRACGFALLAVVTVVVGLSNEPAAAAKAGAILMTLMAAVLAWQGMRAPARSYRRTELWILIDRRHELPEERAQRVIGSLLRERYFWHAQIGAGIAAVCWLLSFAARATGSG